MSLTLPFKLLPRLPPTLQLFGILFFALSSVYITLLVTRLLLFWHGQQLRRRNRYRRREILRSLGVHESEMEGKKIIPSQDYVKYALERPPDIIFSAADEFTHPFPGSRRLKSCLDRTLGWLADLLPHAEGKTSVFATLVGFPNPILVEAFTQELLSSTPYIPSHSLTLSSSKTVPLNTQVAGYALPLRLLRQTVPFVDPPNGGSSAWPPIVALAKTAFGRLTEGKPRAVLDPRGPHEMLRLVKEVGVDVLVDTWTSEVSTMGVALDFEFPVKGEVEVEGRKRDVGVSLFEGRFERDFGGLGGCDVVVEEGEVEPPATKAYIHHLLHSHEMTAHVLLQIHNQNHLLKFLSTIRDLISSPDSTAFDKAYETFFDTYEEAPNGEYRCLVEARKECQRVRSERGKGRDKRKNLKGDMEALPTELQAVKLEEVRVVPPLAS